MHNVGYNFFGLNTGRRISKLEWARITSKYYYCKQCDAQKLFFNGSCTLCGYTFNEADRQKRAPMYCCVCMVSGVDNKVAAYRVGMNGFCFAHKEHAVSARRSATNGIILPQLAHYEDVYVEIDKALRRKDGSTSARRANRARLK